MTIFVPPPEPADVAAAMELEVQRLNTEEFIKADPIILDLTRQQRVIQPSGGYVMEAHPLGLPQTFRLIPASDRMPEIKTSNGRLVVPEYILLGAWDCNMERWDRFELNDVWFEIASPIRPEHTQSRYERKGDVVRREDG